MSYDANNIFARILRGEIPNDTVYEDEEVLAFHDKFPKRKVHVLVIPKGAYVSFDDFTASAGSQAVGHFFEVAGKIAREKLGLAKNGYRIISNCGDDGGQEVPHFHLHIVGGEFAGKMLEKK